MKSARTAVFLMVVIVALVTVWPIPGLRSMWLYDRLEENARQVVTAAQLQSWATNLLAIDPAGTNLERSWGPGFPEQLLKLAPRTGPLVVVYEGDSTNFPGWVRVWWGSGMLGASGFEVGPTNFPGWHPESHKWAPGVYFFRRK